MPPLPWRPAVEAGIVAIFAMGWPPADPVARSPVVLLSPSAHLGPRPDAAGVPDDRDRARDRLPVHRLGHIFTIPVFDAFPDVTARDLHARVHDRWRSA